MVLARGVSHVCFLVLALAVSHVCLLVLARAVFLVSWVGRLSG